MKGPAIVLAIFRALIFVFGLAAMLVGLNTNSPELSDQIGGLRSVTFGATLMILVAITEAGIRIRSAVSR